MTTEKKAKSNRGPSISAAELLKRQGIVVARKTILDRRAQPGASQDVSQADVDLAADALIAERIRPYPRLLLPITGGSLSTVTPLFEDWFSRFLLRGADPASLEIDLPLRVAMQVQLLVAQFAATVREQLRGIENPKSIFDAAVALSDRQALQLQLSAVEKERDELRQAVKTLTACVIQTNTHIEERLKREATEIADLQAQADAAQRAALALREQLAAASSVNPTMLAGLTQDLAQLRHELTARRRRPRLRKRRPRTPRLRGGLRKNKTPASKPRKKPPRKKSRRG